MGRAGIKPAGVLMCSIMSGEPSITRQPARKMVVEDNGFEPLQPSGRQFSKLLQYHYANLPFILENPQLRGLKYVV